MRSASTRGMLWMAATGLLFTLLNTLMKRLSLDLDPWVVGFVRYAFGAIVMLPPALRLGARALWPRAPRLQFLRGAFHAGGMLLWFAALPLVTLPELTAIGFSGPIFVCIGAVLILRERMTGARWTAVLVGFAGVLIVLRPWQGGGAGGLSPGMLLMLASAPVFAGSFLVAKVLTRHDVPAVIVFWQHVWVALLLLPFMLGYWQMPGAGAWLALVVCGFLGAAGHYCMMRAFRVADLSAVQSVKFLELVWAALLGYAVFATLPSAWTVLGGAVILASTLWLARREARSARARAVDA
jgi:drug/metabolite transporter (DMT)-like permease